MGSGNRVSVERVNDGSGGAVFTYRRGAGAKGKLGGNKVVLFIDFIKSADAAAVVICLDKDILFARGRVFPNQGYVFKLTG